MSEINPYKLKISQLRALVAIADFGNFSEAGWQLQLSQSSISHAIAALEQKLGVVLLSRGRHGANLTPVGEKVTSKARQVLSLLEQIADDAKQDRGLQGGKVRIASFRSIATNILPQIIARFGDNLPQIAITVNEFEDTPEIEQKLRQGEADISFTDLNFVDEEEFDTWEIFRDEYVVLLPPSATLNNVELTWEQLASYPLILPSVGCCATLINQSIKKSPVTLFRAYKIRADSTIISMVKQGLGAAILARLAAQPIPEELKVCSLPITVERRIGVVVVKNKLKSPAVYAFLDAVKNIDDLTAREAV